MIDMIDLQEVNSIVDRLIFDKAVKNKRDLAEKLGYTESSLSQILNGKVDLSTKFIKKLSEFAKDIITPLNDLDQQNDCACPFTNSMTEILNISKEIIEMNKKLVDQQSDLISTIKSLAEKQ